MELKDIVLKKGDIVYFESNCNFPTSFVIDVKSGLTVERYCEIIEIEEWKPKIIKIERPIKYKTIYEAPKEILDKEEKEYLENFLRPFRRKVMYISKNMWSVGREYIIIWLSFNEDISLPSFKKDKMYKGMELDKEYTLEELGLFKE